MSTPPIFAGPVTTPIRAAATVVILREGEHGPEVLMLRRHALSEVLGGVFVFPGGKIDAGDLDVARSGRIDASLARLHVRLGEPQLEAVMAAAMFVAACRETLEESGVLFARGVGEELSLLARERACADAGFAGMLDELDLRLCTDALVPWSRWVTPKSPAMMNRRFDARFFVASLPEGQLALHDDYEATESVWMRPVVALERYRAREIVLAPVQIMSLVHLARHSTVGSILEEARSRTPPLIEPQPYEDEAGQAVAYPGHPRHPIATQAIPGPTCLRLRDDRFEPPEGFDSLLR